MPVSPEEGDHVAIGQVFNVMSVKRRHVDGHWLPPGYLERVELVRKHLADAYHRFAAYHNEPFHQVRMEVITT